MAKTKNGPDKKEAVCTPDNVLKEKNMDGLMVEPNNAIIDNDSLSYEIIPVDEEELIEQGYMKLPNKVFTRVSMALQNVPGQVAQQVTINAANKAAEELSKNAYKLVLKEGLHLANSKSLEGAYKGLALNTQNNLTTQADWLPISLDGSVVSRAPQIALGVFNAMSIATGQYFLSQINSKIAEIETGLKDIISYLEAEKRSEITANDMTLMGIFNNLGYIMSNDFERQITATELKEIKRESLSNLLFFQSKIDSIKEDLKITSKSKGDDLAEVFKNLYRDLPLYWCSVRSYVNAAVLETIVSQMDSPKYIDGVKADLNNKILQYEKDCNDIDKKIRTFINKVDDLNKKKVLPSAVKGIADAVPIYGAGWTGLVIKALAFGASEYDEHRERSSKHKKEKALEMRDEFWSACVNMSPLEESTQLLGDYKMSRNSSTEIICSDENAYIKYGELIEEEW